MSRPVTPLRDIGMRLPQAGRIRIGKKGPKGQPQKLDRFRFTSPDRSALEAIARTYGGDVKPWSDPKAGAGQHEVITDATELRIALPPDPLGGSPTYEMWSNGGCQRRCDGVTCEMLVSGPDGLDLQHVSCVCDAKGALECKVTTRLSVLLPDVRFVGVWRLDSHGWNAAQELPGMVDLIRSLQDRGIIRGLLRVEERVQTLAGQTRRYMVPVLGVDESLDALAAGSAAVSSLGAAPATAGELGAGSSGEDAIEQEPTGSDGAEGDGSLTSPGTPDDEVVDAELVDDDTDALVLLRETATTGPKRSKALRAARGAAEAKGLVLPVEFDEIREPVLVAAALEAVR